MPFNGSGVFVRLRSWVNDAASGIRIRADFHDSEDDNFASGLSQCITKDGQTTVTANLPMANFRHTNVGLATATTHYARYDQVQLGKAVWADAGGTADAITASYSPNTIAPVDGQLYYVRAGAANATTTPTFSPDGQTARTIVKYGNQALAPGDIAGDGHELILRYRLSDTKYEILNPFGFRASANNTFSGNNSFTGNNTFTEKVLYPDDGELTIASGVITVTGVYHTVDTEGNAATDDLVTINGGADGQILVLRTENDARDVVIKTTGNIATGGVNDITLGNSNTQIVLQYDSEKTKWLVQSATAAQGGLADTALQPTTGLTRTADFVGAEQAITAANVITIAHGLGSIPRLVTCIIRCKIAESGFAVNEEICVTMLSPVQNTASQRGAIISADATNLYIITGSTGLAALSKSSPGTAVGLTAANWRYEPRAWK